MSRITPKPAPSAGTSSSATQSKIATWADSMGGDQGNLGVALWSGLGTALGVESYNGTFPGFTSSEVAGSHGGLPLYVTITGNNTIPAGTGQVACTVQPTNSFAATNWINYTGTLAGIKGVLNHNGSTNTYTFQRSTAGTAKVISPETPFIADTDQRPSWVHVIRLGRNNNNGNVGADAATIVRDVLAITKRIPHDRYLVLPIYNGTTFATANTQLADRFGPNYYDLRGWLSRNGLAVAGVTPTAGDTTAMGTGDVPPSLMLDAVHMNALGRRLEINRLAEVMVARGWFPSFTPVPLA